MRGWRVRKVEEFPGVWQLDIETFKLFTGTAGVSPAELLQNTSRRFQSGSYHDDFAGETPAVPVKEPQPLIQRAPLKSYGV